MHSYRDQATGYHILSFNKGHIRKDGAASNPIFSFHERHIRKDGFLFKLLRFIIHKLNFYLWQLLSNRKYITSHYFKSNLINPQLYRPLLGREQGERSYFKKIKTRHYIVPTTYFIELQNKYEIINDNFH